MGVSCQTDPIKTIGCETQEGVGAVKEIKASSGEQASRRGDLEKQNLPVIDAQKTEGEERKREVLTKDLGGGEKNL